MIGDRLQPRAFTALLIALLRMDVRNLAYAGATGVKAGEVLPPLYWVVGQILTTSLLVSLMLFGRVSAWFFAFAGLSTAMLVVFSAVVVEFNELALNPGDSDVIGHRPVSGATYAAARLANLGVYVGVMFIATSIFPTVLGAALLDGGAALAARYLFASLLVNVGTAAVVVLLYTLLGAGRVLDRARALLAWIQILSILAAFYGAQLMLRDGDGGVEMFAAAPPDWTRWLPTRPLADAVAGGGLVTLAAASAVVATMTLLAGFRLRAAWSGVLRGEHRLVADPAPAVAPDAKKARRGGVDAAVYRLTRKMIARDAQLAARSWPALGVAAATLLLGAATDQLADPLAESGARIGLTLAFPVLVAAAVPILYQNLVFSRDHEAAWVLLHVPPRAVARGVRKATLLSFVLPCAVLGFGVMAWQWRSPGHAAAVSAMLWLLAEAAARLSEIYVLVVPPFSRPPARGASTGRASLTSAAVTAGGGGVAAMAYAAGRAPVWFVALFGGLLAAVWWLDRWAERHG